MRALSPESGVTSDQYSEQDEKQFASPGISATLGSRANVLTVRDVMTTDVVTVHPNDRLHDVADLMYGKRIHRIIVVEDETVRGVITPFDFVRLYSNDRIGVEGRPDRTVDF
jgi:CBS domain-containing protein